MKGLILALLTTVSLGLPAMAETPLESLTTIRDHQEADLKSFEDALEAVPDADLQKMDTKVIETLMKMDNILAQSLLCSDVVIGLLGGETHLEESKVMLEQMKQEAQ